MNRPPYIVVDEFGVYNSSLVLTSGIFFDLKTNLNLSALNYQYGYKSELDETLSQMSAPGFAGLKYPLVWLAQPFTVTTGKVGIYGTIDELRIFIIGETQKTYKSKERMTNVYKPVISPIFEQLKDLIPKAKAFADYPGSVNCKAEDRYYWGDEKPIVNDTVDIITTRFFNVKIHNNKNCSN